jgi:carboxylesterase type B
MPPDYDLIFANHQALFVDFWAPPPASDKRKIRPTVVLVHGGSFVSGDKSEFKSLGQVLAARGFIVVSVNAI